MEITKIVGGFCGSLLILLLLKFGAEMYYFPHGDHGEAAYTLEVAEGPVEDVVVVPFADLVAAADAGSGERVFNKCKSCHVLDAADAQKTGPYLAGIVDRAQASVEGYGYSSALANLGGTWTMEDLNAFLTKPSDYASGTAMNFPGLPKEKDRANLVAYLATLQ